MLRDWVGRDWKWSLGDVVVGGVFEVYRVRGNFVMLKEKDDPNTMYSPFKVSLSRSITSKLRIDDNVGLTLRLVSGRNFWVPTEFLSYTPTHDPNASESDIEPELYEAEIRKLRESTNPPLDMVLEMGETAAMLHRAKRALEEGELSD